MSNWGAHILLSPTVHMMLGMTEIENHTRFVNYTKNPFNFKHMHLPQLKVYLDSQLQSMKPMEINFATNQHINTYKNG